MSRHTPFEDLERLVAELQDRFEHAQRPATDRARRERGADATLDLVEYDDEYVATVDLPGYDSDDVDVTLEDRALTVTAEREDEETTDDPDGRYVRRQRSRVASTQQVAFPRPVSVEDATARMSNGVLTVTVPKRSARSEGTRIDVE